MIHPNTGALSDADLPRFGLVKKKSKAKPRKGLQAKIGNDDAPLLEQNVFGRIATHTQIRERTHRRMF